MKKINKLRQNKNRAQSLFNKKDFVGAERLYSELCQQSPDAEMYYMLSSTYAQMANYAATEQCAIQALQINSQHELAWNQLGISQAAQRKFEAAINSFNTSHQINPKNVQALINLGNLYREIGQLKQAEHYYKQALLIDNNNFIAINNMANIFLTLCRYDKAEKYYLRAIKLNKNYFDAYYNLGATYQNKGEHKLAINYYKRAQKIQPNNYQPQSAIANSYEKQGEHEKALEIIEALLDKNIIDTDISDIYSKLCIKSKEYDKGITVIKKCLSTQVNPISEQALHFSLGGLYDKNKQYDDAYKEYLLANTMRPYHYNKPYYEGMFDGIKQQFIDEVQSQISSQNSSNVPIFIVGMPRSGTSLIEQILSSHSEVCGAGEMSYIADAAKAAPSSEQAITYPQTIKSMDTKRLDQLAEDYLLKLKKHGDGSHYISDKMPHNFLYLGFIKKLFPNCKVIHCLRNPLDVCLSIYFHNFNHNHPYTDQLANLGHYYNLYRELMVFWHKQYEGFIIDIQYEELLVNPEENVKKLLEHVGLDWQNSCMKFYENKRTVSTPSYSQVSQPLYTSSMERWRNYADYIADLKSSINSAYLLKP